MKSVALGYIGIHHLFAQAQALKNKKMLAGLFCSSTGGYGMNRYETGVADLIGQVSIETFSLPVWLNRIVNRLKISFDKDHYWSNCWFDYEMSKWLSHIEADFFVGTETCAMSSFKIAKTKGMKTILDLPGIPTFFLDGQVEQACEKLKIKWSGFSNSKSMQLRKIEELAMADRVLCCSELQKNLLKKEDQERAYVLPLWVDSNFWSRQNNEVIRKDGPLRILYAGALNIAKGVPFLLEAVKMLGDEVQLTLVGKVTDEIKNYSGELGRHKVLGMVNKQKLKQLYVEHDVMIMPTLGDSFGLVAMEAMAAGLPVIVSDAAGVPLWDEQWRFSAGSVEAIVEKIEKFRRAKGDWAEMSRLVIKYASDYNLTKYHERFIDYLNECNE